MKQYYLVCPRCNRPWTIIEDQLKYFPTKCVHCNKHVITVKEVKACPSAPYSDELDVGRDEDGPTHKAYVIKHKSNNYCAFGSYCVARLVDNPLFATHYRNLVVARKRLRKEIYLDGALAKPGDFSVAEIKVEVVGETLISTPD